LAGTFAIAIFGGCADESFDGVPLPNSTPDTHITAMPPLLDATGSSVAFAWSGFDPDGSVVRYQWRISDNGADHRLDPPDTLLVAWHTTSAADSVFEVSAVLDSFPPDVGDPRQSPRDHRGWQTHTFFVRAVDDRGAVDPTPAHVSFTATTLAPTVVIDLPAAVTNNSCTQAGPLLRFGWTGVDPDGPQGDRSPPDSVRTVWWQVPDCVTRTQFVQSNPLAAAPQSAWSPWIAYDAEDGAGRRVTLPAQPPNLTAFFAVQAKDRAGAVTPTLEWGVNVRHLEIGIGKRPVLSVVEKYLGGFEFSSAGGWQQFEVVPGQPLEFQMLATADSYASVIDGYRYGWDVADVFDPNDPGWVVPWGDYHRSGVRSFAGGSHNFVVQARDLAGTVVRGIFALNVMEPPPRPQQRPLLLVNDWPHGSFPSELALAASWAERWRTLLDGIAAGFDASRDILDLYGHPEGFSLTTLLRYRSVIHFIKGSDKNSRFHARFAPWRAGSHSVLRYNWFEAYQARQGNVLIAGPGAMFGSLESDPPIWAYPIVFDDVTTFGSITLPDGSVEPGGRSRYPYRAFCLEALDHIRPPGGWDGPIGTDPRRQSQCDAISRARVDAAFLDAYPSAAGRVVELAPNADRGQNFVVTQGSYQWMREEFYDTDVSAHPAVLRPRPCQTTMYTALARRDDGWVEHPDSTCTPPGSAASPLDGVPIGIASTIYSATKPVPGAPDFVWGFHPLGMEAAGMRSALLWIVRDAWQLPAP
jgi:hypothetical protein